ncbi:MAG: hypothetical protein E7352_03795 [Clostridiales bacterium]|nr:hypothetical protein [Clostridiales bacterium]
MEIDIISYTPSQYTALTNEQLTQVKEAQIKKNELLQEYATRLQKEKGRLIENGIIASGIWPKLEEKLRNECNNAVAWVRDTLLFYLQYSGAEAMLNAPYKVDLTLPIEERLAIVKDYYYTTYSNALERLNAYEKDEVAMKYLGEVYAMLYDYLEDDL